MWPAARSAIVATAVVNGSPWTSVQVPASIAPV